MSTVSAIVATQTAVSTIGVTRAALCSSCTAFAFCGVAASGAPENVRQHLWDAGPIWLWQSPAIASQHSFSLTSVAVSIAQAIRGAANKNATTASATIRASNCISTILRIGCRADTFVPKPKIAKAREARCDGNHRRLCEGSPDPSNTGLVLPLMGAVPAISVTAAVPPGIPEAAHTVDKLMLEGCVSGRNGRS